MLKLAQQLKNHFKKQQKAKLIFKMVFTVNLLIMSTDLVTILLLIR